MARKISIRQAINEAIDQEMQRDPTVIVMGEDIVGGTGAPGEADAWGGVLGVTKGLYAKHGSSPARPPIRRWVIFSAFLLTALLTWWVKSSLWFLSSGLLHGSVWSRHPRCRARGNV